MKKYVDGKYLPFTTEEAEAYYEAIRFPPDVDDSVDDYQAAQELLGLVSEEQAVNEILEVIEYDQP